MYLLSECEVIWMNLRVYASLAQDRCSWKFVSKEPNTVILREWRMHLKMQELSENDLEVEESSSCLLMKNVEWTDGS